MYYVTRIDDSAAAIPPKYAGSSEGYRQQVLISRATGSPHMSLSVGHLAAGGHVEAVVHSFEVSLYVFDGTLAVTMLGETTHLGADHAIVIPVGVTYALRAVEGAPRWLQMSAPGELDDGRREDTFFTGDTLVESAPVIPDMRDPRNQHAVRFDAASMDLKKLAHGAPVADPTASPSMATALLAYSGIGVRMLIDQRVGAQLHTMFIVDYQPTAIAHPHDHPFEEAYIFVEGEVHALVDGDELVLHPGDVLWAGVGADHGFENRSDGLVRWIETQAPQPPAQHSYRFSREWEHLADKLGESHGHSH
ncbi:MAG: cupin domain-containing protein [Acidobacteriota bacterium]|nr:cupin domain-containing protein [Acidobacteriota bacterium]MDE3082610.1 cupin domain-containing protein [Acidobacteriota bacterium]